MEANEILQTDILDIIFEGKNKSYGAYQLRKTYNQRLAKAMGFTAFLLMLAFIGTVLASNPDKNKRDLVPVKDIIMHNVKEIPVAPPLAIPPVATIINQVRSVIPVIVADHLVSPDDKIEDINENLAISTVTLKSDIITPVVKAPLSDTNSYIVEKPVNGNDENIIFVDAQIQAAFPGGFAAWKKYLENNLDPETPVSNGAPAGAYTVMVRFVVSKDGNISDVMPETTPGYGMEAEAIKIIKNGPKWTPARNNGQLVNAYRRQPITFIVSEQ